MSTCAFWTEKQIEEWLESETRLITLPDGSTRPLTDFRMTWVLYDDLIQIWGYTPEQFVRWAVEETTLHGITLEKAFGSIVAYVDEHVRNLRRQSQRPC